MIFETDTPATEEPSIIKNNKADSNFFNSMLASEEKAPDKTDDIFGFLSQPIDSKGKSDPFSACKNKNEEDIFALLSGEKKNDQPQAKEIQRWRIAFQECREKYCVGVLLVLCIV